MSDSTFPREGGCMCGRVRVRVTAAAILTLACHCTGCQRLSASAFSLTVMFPAAAFEVVSGETQIGALHGQTPYHYCGYCLNWLFTAPAAPFVMTRPAMFDAPQWSTPFVETFVSEKLSWASTPAQHSFAAFPAEDQYGPILAAYAAWAAAHNGPGTAPATGDAARSAMNADEK